MCQPADLDGGVRNITEVRSDGESIEDIQVEPADLLGFAAIGYSGLTETKHGDPGLVHAVCVAKTFLI